MIEIIDKVSKVKMIAMIVTFIEYHNDKYVIYCIDRGSGNANIFASKLIATSEGYTFNDDFLNGEKVVLDNFVKKIINKENIEVDGIRFISDIKLMDVIYFNVDKCYVSTISKNIIKDIMIYYKLINESIFKQPVVEVVEDKRVFNEGFVGNIFLIVFGIMVIIFSIIVMVGVFR